MELGITVLNSHVHIFKLTNYFNGSYQGVILE